MTAPVDPTPGDLASRVDDLEARVASLEAIADTQTPVVGDQVATGPAGLPDPVAGLPPLPPLPAVGGAGITAPRAVDPRRLQTAIDRAGGK